MSLEKILKSIDDVTSEDKFEFIIDYLNCELESDRHSYDVIHDSISAIELSIQSIGDLNKLNPKIFETFKLCKSNMSDLMDSVEYMMSLCDIIMETYELSDIDKRMKDKILELYNGNCEIFKKCKTCQIKLEEILP